MWVCETSLRVCPYVSDGAVKAGSNPNGLELLAHARFGWSPVFRWAWLLEKRVTGMRLHSSTHLSRLFFIKGNDGFTASLKKSVEENDRYRLYF